MATPHTSRQAIPVVRALDCRTCSGSGHGEQLTVDSFARCPDCHGTGVATCDYCRGHAARRYVGDRGDVTCIGCDEHVAAVVQP